MIYRPDYDENGKKVLCEMNGVNPEMLMDIYVKKLKKGETLEILEEKNECAVLLLSGEVNFKVGSSIDETCKRANPFEKKPYAVHFPKQVKAVITALADSEILVQQTDNEKTWEPVFYNPENCLKTGNECSRLNLSEDFCASWEVFHWEGKALLFSLVR